MTSITTNIPQVAHLRPRFVIDEKGRKTDAIFTYKEYMEIQRMLEDFFDIVIAESRMNDENVTLEELQKELEADGIL